MTSAVRLVATRELTERLRSRAFIVSNVGIMALLVLALVLPALLGEDGPRPIGHVGPDAARVAALAQAQQAAFDLEVELVALDDRSAAEAALAADEVEVVLLDGGRAVADDDPGPQLGGLLSTAASALAVDDALAGAGLDVEERAALLTPTPLVLERLDEDAGEVDLFDPAVGIVFAAVFMLYGLLAVYGQWVAQGIVEEKQSRVVEVLLASLRPTELLAGKVLGLGLLGLGQILLLVGVGIAGLLITDAVDVPPAARGALALVIPWYVLGFLLYATMFAVAGSLVARVEDLQSTIMPVVVVLVLALFAAQFALSDPGGTVATVAAVLPLTAPIVQPVLFALGETSPAEVAAAVALSIAAIALMIPLAARVYRAGSLRTRGSISLRQAWGDKG